MTRGDIEKIRLLLPDLNVFGVGMYDLDGKSPAELAAQFEANKLLLLESADACTQVCVWLLQIRKTAAINLRHSSYGLKHIAEPDIGYVSNGAFIAAAIHSGYPYQATPGRPNVMFGMDEASLEAVIRRQEASTSSREPQLV